MTAADRSSGEDAMPAEMQNQAAALHDPTALLTLFGASMRAYRLPTNALAEYFGPRAGAYFAFLDTYSRSFVLPSILVIFAKSMQIRTTPRRVAALRVTLRFLVTAWAFQVVRHVTRRSLVVDVLERGGSRPERDGESSLDPRRRRMSSLGLEKLGADPSGLVAAPRPDVGDLLASAASTAGMLAGVGAWFVVAMNCMGYIVDRKSRLAVGSLQRLAAPGGLLDKKHHLKMYIAPVTHVFVVYGLGVQYARAVELLSLRDGTGNDGVIAKRLMFEAIYAFMPLTWLALVRRDKAALASEVQAIYATDEIRRVVCGTVMPYVQAARQRRSGALRNEADLELGEWEDFNDWLEMATQFTYVVFLGADAPFVVPFSLLSNIIEERSSVFKLCYCKRRPQPEQKAGLRQDARAWIAVLNGVAFFGAVINGIGIAKILLKGSTVVSHPLMS